MSQVFIGEKGFVTLIILVGSLHPVSGGCNVMEKLSRGNMCHTIFCYKHHKLNVRNSQICSLDYSSDAADAMLKDEF